MNYLRPIFSISGAAVPQKDKIILQHPDIDVTSLLNSLNACLISFFSIFFILNVKNSVVGDRGIEPHKRPYSPII